MATTTTRIKDIPTTATTAASDDYFVIDGATNGTRKYAHGADPTAHGVSTSANETAVLGPELATQTGWTATGWTGDFNTGFTHTTGAPASLVFTPTGIAAGKRYQIEFTISGATTGTFTVSLGGSPTFDTYKGALNQRYYFGIKAQSTAALTIAVVGAFDGVVSGISIKEITGPSEAVRNLKDSAGATVSEDRWSALAAGSRYSGLNSGKYATTGEFNMSFGTDSLSEVTTGFWNAGFGVNSGKSITTGSRNSLFGYNSGNSITVGIKNNLHGTFCGGRITSGSNNDGFGCDALFYLTTGSANAAFGYQALYSLTTGSYNFAGGYGALAACVTGSNNTALGYFAGSHETGSYTIYIDSIVRQTATEKIQTPIYFRTSTTMSAQLGRLNGRMAINAEPVATAHLALPADASTAPVNIAAGLMTVPVAGSIESDGTYLYFTDSTGTRRRLAFA